MLFVLIEAYTEDELGGETRTYLKFVPKIAPVKVAVFPLKKNEPRIVEVAKKIKNDLQPFFRTLYDDSAGIGKLYRRQDEVGTPFCVTVDFDTLGQSKDGSTALKDTVTVRDRDTMQQIRLPIAELLDYIRERI